MSQRAWTRGKCSCRGLARPKRRALAQLVLALYEHPEHHSIEVERCPPIISCSSALAEAAMIVAAHTELAPRKSSAGRLHTASMLALLVSCSFLLPNFEIWRKASTP